MVLTFIRASLWQSGDLDRFSEGPQESPKLGISVIYGEIPEKHYDHNIDNAEVNTFTETVLRFGCPKDIFGMCTDVELQDMFRITYDDMSMEENNDWNTEEM